jgi:uncharacterized protein YggU (UPF0235/DUF167 family)
MRPDGLEVQVRAQPRARRAAIRGRSPDGTALVVAVTEPPEDGRANRAIEAAIAAALGCPASAVAVTRGATARHKTLSIAGEPAALAAKLERLLA